GTYRPPYGPKRPRSSGSGNVGGSMVRSMVGSMVGFMVDLRVRKGLPGRAPRVAVRRHPVGSRLGSGGRGVAPRSADVPGRATWRATVQARPFRRDRARPFRTRRFALVGRPRDATNAGGGA